jgi:hypothetical protein
MKTQRHNWFRCTVVKTFEAATAVRRWIQRDQRARGRHPLVKVYRLVGKRPGWGVYVAQVPDPDLVARWALSALDPEDLWRVPESKRRSHDQLVQDLRGSMGDQISEMLSGFYMDLDGWKSAIVKDPMANMGDFFYYNTDYDDFLRAVLGEMIRRHEGK